MIEKDVKVFVSVAERDHDCDAMSGETRLRRVESARLDAGVVKRLDYFQRLWGEKESNSWGRKWSLIEFG